MRIACDAMAATTRHHALGLPQGRADREVAQQLMAAAKQLARNVIVDPRASDYARYHGADVVTPNRRELAEATGLSVDTEAGIVAAAQVLLQRHGFGAVLVTRAEDGMSPSNTRT